MLYLASCIPRCLNSILLLAEAVPKRILDLMNVEGLTRENVASHLQVLHQQKPFCTCFLPVTIHRGAADRGVLIGTRS